MREVIASLSQSEIPFLIIGGHALSVHGVQRDTVDIDCLIAAERGPQLAEYLRRHGFEEMARRGSFARFRHHSLVYPFLDVMEVNSATWSKMAAGSQEGTLFGCSVRVPAVPHYIALKLHAICQDLEREDRDRQDIVSLVAANPKSTSVAELEALCTRYAPPGFWDTLRPKLKL